MDPNFRALDGAEWSGITVHQQSKPDTPDNRNPPFGNDQDSHIGKKKEVSDVDRITTAWNEIRNLRDSVTRSRLELRERRVELRQERARARELEAQLWRNIQSNCDGDGLFDQVVLGRLYLEVNTARDEMGPTEENYNELEDDLGMMEYKLEKKEARFYSQFANTHHDENFKPSFTDSSTESGRPWSHSSASEHTDNSSSPSNRYLSKLGDANIMRERLLELESERSHYLDLARERDALGHPLYQPNVEFLNSFPDVHARYLEELHRIEDELKVFRNDASLPEYVLTRGTSSTASPDVPAKASSLQNVSRYSEPLPASTAARRGRDLDAPHDPTAIPSPRKRIDQWILEMLINSVLERARHKAILDDPSLDDSEWLSLVRKYWGRDCAAHPLHSRRGEQARYSASAGSAHFGADTNNTSLGTSYATDEHAPEPKIDHDRLAHIGLVNLDCVYQLLQIVPKASLSPTNINPPLRLQDFLEEKI